MKSRFRMMLAILLAGTAMVLSPISAHAANATITFDFSGYGAKNGSNSSFGALGNGLAQIYPGSGATAQAQADLVTAFSGFSPSFTTAGGTNLFALGSHTLNFASSTFSLAANATYGGSLTFYTNANYNVTTNTVTASGTGVNASTAVMYFMTATGYRGTIQFGIQTRSGSLGTQYDLTATGATLEGPAVTPAPLALLGVVAAGAWSRKLRRRVKLAKGSDEAIAA
jgi:hypothetical protein